MIPNYGGGRVVNPSTGYVSGGRRKPKRNEPRVPTDRRYVEGGTSAPPPRSSSGRRTSYNRDYGSADAAERALTPPGPNGSVADIIRRGFDRGAPADPMDALVAQIQGLMSQGTATPAISQDQYLAPFDSAQSSLNQAAMQGHAEIERNHQALTAALAARQKAGQQGLTTYTNDLAASTSAAQQAINGLGTGGGVEERGAQTEAQANMIELARLQRDLNAGAVADQQAGNLERSQTADDIRAAALGSIAANQNRAQTGIATGRANAAMEYQRQVAEAQGAAQGQQLDALKFLYGAQRDRITDERADREWQASQSAARQEANATRRQANVDSQAAIEASYWDIIDKVREDVPDKKPSERYQYAINLWNRTKAQILQAGGDPEEVWARLRRHYDRPV